jgi:hypothetical protein
MSAHPHLAVLEGGEHRGEIRPNPDTIVSERSGRPVKLAHSAVTWPLLADCATCGERIRLDRPYGDWQHAAPPASSPLEANAGG